MARKKEDTGEKAKEIAEGIAGGVQEIAEKALEVEVKGIKRAVRTIKKADKDIGEKIDQALGNTDKESKDEKAAKLKKLKELAKALEKKVEEKKLDIKKELRGEEEKKETLVPIEDYLKSSIHLGTRVITPDMRKYVYRRRADGLAVFNTALLDEKMREGAEYLSKFAPENMVIVCKREAGWKAAELFAKTFGIRYFTKKYPAGIITNTNLEDFFETDLIFICDPWLDKNALSDANKIKINVIGVCDTNNFTRGINFILPGNNKSWKSLGMIFYLLAKLYSEKRKIDVQVPSIGEFVESWDNLQPPM